MAENDGKVVFELDVDDSQVQGKIDRAIGEMRRAAQSGKNALLSLDADTAAALARLHRVQAESGAAGAIAPTDAGAASGATTPGRYSAAVGGAPSPAGGADISRGAGLEGALADAAVQADRVAVNAGGMADASASAAAALAGQAEMLARQAELMAGQTEALTGQAGAAQGAEAAMRSAWASMALIDGAAAGLRASILAARDAAGGISGAISGLISRIRSGSNGASGGGAGTTHLSKYAVGLDVVPYDDYPALLHRGEMVLNAAEASAYRMGGQRDAGVGIDYEQLARAMANVSLEMDGQKVGRLVEKSVSTAQSLRYNRAARKG